MTLKIKQIVKKILICCCFIPTVHSQEFSVGWELWYPYQFHSKENKLTGLDIDIFNIISKKANMKVSYVELPWQRHLMYIKTGDIDIAVGASYSKEREKTAYFSVPYRKESVNLFVKKGMSDSIKIKSLPEISSSDFLFGVENGYYYGKQYQQLTSDTKFMSHINGVLDIEQNVKMLLRGHIDGFFADPITMKIFVEKYKLQNEFELHPLLIDESDIHIMLSKKSFNKEDLDKLNKIIIQLKENGTLAKTIKRWSATD